MSLELPVSIIVFTLLLIAIAFLYASIGHGGASGYMALMALFSFPPGFIKPAALLLNLFVAGTAFWFFKKNKYFSWQLFYPFAITSIPAAFLGGYLRMNAQLYKYLLAFFLLIAVLKMLVSSDRKKKNTKPVHVLWALLIGFVIGLFSGMIGIGGGIILSPVILLLAWGNMKEAAAVSALFILVNSAAGITGYLLHQNIWPAQSFWLVPFALLGGILGAKYGSSKFSNRTLNVILSVVLLMASLKLFLL